SVTSACVMLRREVFEQLGGFDERFQVCGSDVEIGLRLNAQGLRVVYTPHAQLVHHESASRRADAIPEGDYWHSFTAYRPYLRDGDPFYNPALTLEGGHPDRRRDPRDGELLALRTLARDLPSTRAPHETERARRQRHRVAELESLDASPADLARVRE